MILRNGVSVGMEAHMDVRSFARAESGGSSISALESSIASSFTALGSSRTCHVEVTRNAMVSDVVGISAEFTPDRDMDTSQVDQLLLQAANLTAPNLVAADKFLPHQGGLSALMPGDAHGEVIDASSVHALAAGASVDTPTASDSWIGRITSAFSSTASTDPARDGHTRASLEATELSGMAIPTWVYIVGGVAGFAVVALAAAYVIRSVK